VHALMIRGPAGKRRILELVRGDITREKVAAVVNAANQTLLGGGGVDGAIHRRGGLAILEECRRLGGCATGDAKITTGGNLPAKHVIHTVGPIYQGGGRGEAGLLASAYRRSLEVADEHALTSIAFPSISTGAYRYPIEQAARIALATVKSYLEGETHIQLARFVLFSSPDLEVYARALEELAGESSAEGKRE
jgi:O-acetyl-ADP-ribose deacetylase (regulator of RNase III)